MENNNENKVEASNAIDSGFNEIQPILGHSENINQVENDDSNKIDKVIQTLPEPLKSCLVLLDNYEERKMGLYALAAITGSLMPFVWMNYGERVSHPNLMIQVCYPPGSGKGKLSAFTRLFKKISSEKMSQNKEAMETYNQKKKEYDKSVKSKTIDNLPLKPKCPIINVPGNITSAKLMEQLVDNDGKMVVLIFETETDALTSMMKGKFGQETSMMLRKAFHNEQISSMRKTNNEHLVASNPKINVIVSGTFSQLKSLFRNLEDGFFSRFMIVTGDIKQDWEDVQPKEGSIPLEDKLEEFGNIFYEMYKYFENRTVEFKLSNEQWRRINSFGENKLSESLELGGEYATSIAKRHALMIARVACIFSMVRYFENKSSESEWYCNMDDFESAMIMGEESYNNSIDLFQKLQDQKSVDKSSIINELYERIPSRFKTRELAPLMKSMGIAERTIFRHLKELVKMGKLISPSKGYYEKNTMAEVADGSKIVSTDPLENNGDLNPEI